MTSVTNDDRIRRGTEAKAILEHPLVIESFAALEAEIIEEIKRCQPRDTNELARLHLMLHLSQRWRLHFEALIRTGSLAEHTLAQRLIGRRRLSG